MERSNNSGGVVGQTIQWTQEMDKVLQDSVLRNYFNFDMVSVEMIQNVTDLNIHITNDMCRSRWTQLHKQRKRKQNPSYPKEEEKVQQPIQPTKPKVEENLTRMEIEEVQDKENSSPNTMTQKSNTQAKKKSGVKFNEDQISEYQKERQQQKDLENEPLKLLNNKDFSKMTDKPVLTDVNQIENNMWKYNILRTERKNIDYLDVSNEDFSKNYSRNFQGDEIIPSTFNIFRDSLKQHSNKLTETLNENLPDMNLQELESESESEISEEDVLPLDFRTALLEKDQKVVIQAKPMHFKTAEEDLEDIRKEEELKKKLGYQGEIDSYLEAAKQESFKGDDVILIDPDFNIEEKFGKIDLECNANQRINNTIDADLRQIPVPITTRKKQQPPSSTNQALQKQYDTDTDTEKQIITTGNVNTIHQKAVKHQQQLQLKQQKSSDSQKQKPKTQEELNQEEFDSITYSEDFIDKYRKQRQQEFAEKMFGGNKSQENPMRLVNPDQGGLDFDDVLQSMGIDDIDKFIDGKGEASSDNNEPAKKTSSKKQQEVTKPQPVATKVNNFVTEEKKEETLPQKPQEVKKEPKKTEPKPTPVIQDSFKSEKPETDQNLTSEDFVNKQKFNETNSLKNSIGLMASLLNENKQSASKKSSQPYGISQVMSALNKQEKEAKASGQQQPATTAREVIEDTRLKQMKALKQQKATGSTNQQINTQDPDKKSESSDDSHDSAEDYFNQQRKMIRQKIVDKKKVAESESESEMVPQVIHDRNWSDDDGALPFSQQQESEEELALKREQARKEALEKQRQQEAREKEEREQEARRVQIIREQQRKMKEQREREEQERVEKERKLREKEELQAKLNQQNEERKKRKREEKEKKEHEKEMVKKLEEIKRENEEREQRQRLAQIQKEREAEEQKRRDNEDNERRAHEFEQSIRQMWNGSDVPCLFEQKIAYSSCLKGLPLNIEKDIQTDSISKEDLTFGRFKTILIPLDLLNHDSLTRVIQYFLRKSDLPKIDKENKLSSLNQFAFKLISMQMTVIQPSFKTFSLHLNKKQQSYRVLALMFDTNDKPASQKGIYDVLKSIKLSQVISQKDVTQFKQIYPLFMTELAENYIKANKQKEFPITIEKVSAGRPVFKTPIDHLVMNPGLDLLCFTSDYAKFDESGLPESRQTWDLFRRYPNFYAFNPNKKSYTKIEPPKNKLKCKHNQYKFENITVVFKDETFGVDEEQAEHKTKCLSSIEYFFKKAIIKEGLDLCAIRLVYLQDKDTDLYKDVFQEKIFGPMQGGERKMKPVLACMVRGIDAVQKVNKIIGYTSPQIARKTGQKSLRAMFGKTKDENCVVNTQTSQKKNLYDINFWFGGRVYAEIEKTSNFKEAAQLEQMSPMYVVCPPKINKSIFMISPLLKSNTIPIILSKMSKLGFHIINISKLDFSKLSYENQSIQHFQRQDVMFKVGGQQFPLSIGYVLTVARENLMSHFSLLLKHLEKDLIEMGQLSNEYPIDQLLWMTSTYEQYKTIKLKQLNKIAFNVNHVFTDSESDSASNEEAINRRKRRLDPNYDSEDTSLYRDLYLYSDESRTKLSGNIQLSSKKGSSVSARKVNTANKYKVQTFVAFVKLSTFKKNSIMDTLQALQGQGFEILGSKILKAKKEIYGIANLKVQHTIKQIAYKFYEHHKDIRIRYKVQNFQTLVLVLRGNDVENRLDNIYDREKCKFLDSFGIYEMSPQTLFLTNPEPLKIMLDFIVKSEYIKLYHDVTSPMSHLVDSQEFLNLTLRFPTEKSSLQIKSQEALMESTDQKVPSQCLVIVKPNQPFNVALRTLKSIANLEDSNPQTALQIRKIQLVKYSKDQAQKLYEQDIKKDESIPKQARMTQYMNYLELIFSKQELVLQFIVEGMDAIAQVREIIGDKVPQNAEKDTLRSFYGQDRFDNAFYITESLQEFGEDLKLVQEDDEEALAETALKRSIISLKPKQDINEHTPIAQIMMQNKQEVALVLIAPHMVQSKDFVFVVEDMHRSKFNVCAIKQKQLSKDDLTVLFKDLAPRRFNIDVMWDSQFHSGESILVVVEKEKALMTLQNMIGDFKIQSKKDFEKTKKKQLGSGYGLGKFGCSHVEQSLISEYGSYMFCFPFQEKNNDKIAYFFDKLPNSKHFKVDISN